MKMWGEEKPTWRRDINKKAAQVQLEDWTKKKQPMEVRHGHREECPKNKQLAGLTLDQLEDWSTRSIKKGEGTVTRCSSLLLEQCEAYAWPDRALL